MQIPDAYLALVHVYMRKVQGGTREVRTQSVCHAASSARFFFHNDSISLVILIQTLLQMCRDFLSSKPADIPAVPSLEGMTEKSADTTKGLINAPSTPAISDEVKRARATGLLVVLTEQPS